MSKLNQTRPQTPFYDGEFHPSEREILAKVADYPGIGKRQLEHLLSMLMAQGVPADMLKLATEKVQEIQAAYDVIKKSRR